MSLFDKFGDGWSGAVVEVTRPSSASYSQTRNQTEYYSSTCSKNPTKIPLCADYTNSKDYGYYIFSVLYNSDTKHLWEIYWTVQNTVHHDLQTFTGN